jgi:hypothetical protein
MDEKGFRQFLKKAGKKEHVVEGLIRQVGAFEAHLSKKKRTGVEKAEGQDILDYAKSLDKNKVKTQVRGLALYYKFVGNSSLMKLAGALREKETAKTRQAFKLRKFRGVNLDDVGKLEAMGIVTVEHMLAAGRTPAEREKLASRTGISPQSIMELVKLSDLSRVGAIKSVRARLYYDAGLDTPDKFTRWKTEDLRQMLIEFVERSGFDGIAPLPKELHNAIETAKKLPKIIKY